MANENGVLIFAETTDGALAPISAELLALARRLGGALGQPACAALIGSGVSGLAQEVIACGADKVFVAEDAQLSQYTADAYVSAMEQVCKQANPALLLLPCPIALGCGRSSRWLGSFFDYRVRSWLHD